ncbi:MAG: sigma-E factor negative regulatory protein [Woeseiaceae bacterium]
MQISAFVDGELPENESELLLRRLSQDTALRQQVAQYLEIGRLIRGDHEVTGMSTLRDRIAAALGEEPVEASAESGVTESKFTKPAIGMAIAASVAVLALVAVGRVYPPSGSTEDAPGYTVPESQTVASQPDDELLKLFYLHHNPRLVTWQLRDGSLVEIQADEEADTDEENQD